MKQKVIPAEERQRRIQAAIKREPSPLNTRDRQELDKNMHRLERVEAFENRRAMSMSLYLITDALKRFFASRALYYAARFGKVALAEKLIDTYGADINRRGGRAGHTPLHQAVIHKKLGMAEFLLKKGAQIWQNKNGDTPPVVACAFGRPLAISMFYRYGFDFNKPDIVWSWKPNLLGWGREKHYPLAIAFFCCHPKTLQAVIDTGVNLNRPVLYTGLFHRRRTLLQEIENPSLTLKWAHPMTAVSEVVKQAVATQRSKMAEQCVAKHREHIRQ